jgi:hypothetical protein
MTCGHQNQRPSRAAIDGVMNERTIRDFYFSSYFSSARWWGSLATLNRCLDLDVTFIDTANVHGGGNNGCNPADPRRAARMKEGST